MEKSTNKEDNSQALAVAIYNNSPSDVKSLIEQGVDVNLPNVNGTPSLSLSISQKKTEIAKLLIGQGAEVNLQDQNGTSPLRYIKWSRRNC